MEGAVVGPARIQLEMADCHNVLVYFHVVCVYVAFSLRKCVCVQLQRSVCGHVCVCDVASFSFPPHSPIMEMFFHCGHHWEHAVGGRA